MKKLKTLKELYNEFINSEDKNVKLKESTIWLELQDMAKEWIKFYRKNRELHWQYLNNTLGDNPPCKIPKGLKLDSPYGCSLINPDGYEEKIELLKLIFNIKEENLK